MPYVMWRGVAAPLWLVLIFMQRRDDFNSRSLSCPAEGRRSLAVTSAPGQLELSASPQRLALVVAWKEGEAQL